MSVFRTRVLGLLLATVVAGGSPASAQHDVPDVVLDSLMVAAVAHNPDILAAEQKVDALKQHEAQVSALDDPMISYSHWLSTPETRVGPQTDAFMLSQPIPFPGKLGLRGDIASEEATSEAQRADATRRDVLFKVKSAYYNLYRIDQSLAILDEYLGWLRDFSKVAEQKYATGSGIQANALKSQVEISTILDKRLMFERQRSGVVARINALIDRPPDATLGMARTIDTSRMVIDDSSLVAMALANRQELKVSESNIRRSEYMKDLAGMQYYPNLNLLASYIIVAHGSSMASDAGKDAYSIGVGINLPIQFGRRSAATEEAEAMVRANQLNHRNIENNVKAEIQDFHFQLESIGHALDLYNEGLLVQAQSALESALSAYSTGTLDFLNLLDSLRTLLHVRLGYVEQQSNYQQTLAALERSVGGILVK